MRRTREDWGAPHVHHAMQVVQLDVLHCPYDRGNLPSRDYQPPYRTRPKGRQIPQPRANGRPAMHAEFVLEESSRSRSPMAPEAQWRRRRR
eukprot:2262625-Prymnesium_polylepis.1